LNSVAFRELPVPAGDRLVSVYQDFRGVTQRRVNGARSMFSASEYRSYRDRTQTLSGLMGWGVVVAAPQDLAIRVAGDPPALQISRPSCFTAFSRATPSRSQSLPWCSWQRLSLRAGCPCRAARVDPATVLHYE
jgi:hypothetical protein